jgi:hypothetical protein
MLNGPGRLDRRVVRLTTSTNNAQLARYGRVTNWPRDARADGVSRRATETALLLGTYEWRSPTLTFEFPRKCGPPTSAKQSPPTPVAELLARTLNDVN